MKKFINDFLIDTCKFVTGTKEYINKVLLVYLPVLFTFLLCTVTFFVFLYCVLYKFDIIPMRKPYYVWVYARPDNTNYYYHSKAKVQNNKFKALYIENKEINIDDSDYESISKKGELMHCEDENGIWWDLRYYGEK